MTAPTDDYYGAGAGFYNTFARYTDTNYREAGAYNKLSDDLAQDGITLTPQQAANWAAAGFKADEARECIQAGFAPDESGSAQAYTAAGLYSPQEAYLERLEAETFEMLVDADQIAEAQDRRQEQFEEDYEVDEETGLVKPRPVPDDDWPVDDTDPVPEEGYPESDIEGEWAGDHGDREAARAQEQGERQEYMEEGIEDAETYANNGSRPRPGVAGGTTGDDDPWTDPAEEARFQEWLREQAAEGNALPGDVPGDDQWNAASAEATADTLDRIDQTLAETDTSTQGWTAEDQAAFEQEVDASADPDAPLNPLYVQPEVQRSDPSEVGVPPANEEPEGCYCSACELADGVSHDINRFAERDRAEQERYERWQEAERSGSQEEADRAANLAAWGPGAEHENPDGSTSTLDEDGVWHVRGGVLDDDGAQRDPLVDSWSSEQMVPTDEQLDRGEAVRNGDGTYSWSPLHHEDDPWDRQPDATHDEEGAGMPARLSEEAEEIARGVEQREADAAAIEDDPFMAGSEAEAAYYWENGGEWPEETSATYGSSDWPGDAERTAQVEEDAAERAEYVAEQQAEVDAEEAERIRQQEIADMNDPGWDDEVSDAETDQAGDSWWVEPEPSGDVHEDEVDEDQGDEAVDTSAQEASVRAAEEAAAKAEAARAAEAEAAKAEAEYVPEEDPEPPPATGYCYYDDEEPF